jgi:hypothetical protein
MFLPESLSSKFIAEGPEFHIGEKKCPFHPVTLLWGQRFVPLVKFGENP